jgi:hypothetical protein
MSIVIAKTEKRQPKSFQVMFDEGGIFSFEEIPKSSNENIGDVKKQFQLLASSRYSFFGCWLHMAPLPGKYSEARYPDAINKTLKRKWLFIYRDSLTAEDFSRLSTMIIKLKTAT